MKKFIVVMFLIMFSAGIAIAGGGQVRGDDGTGTIVQDFCGPDDECAGVPYWWGD
jgi:hypothetical protein